jgi:hypothetical protein
VVVLQEVLLALGVLLLLLLLLQVVPLPVVLLAYLLEDA